MQDYRSQIAAARAAHARLLDAFVEREGAALERLAQRMTDCLRGGGKLLLFGNGGSAAQAQHLAAELVNRYERARAGLAAIALTADGAVVSSIANDDAFDRVFARQLEALSRPGDLALALSTTGRSPNVIAALRVARALELRTAALLGGDGGPARALAELALVVPGDHTPRIQEVQLFAGHWLCSRVEHLLASGASNLGPP